MHTHDEATSETRMDMTPMIDVTFQLIIFFLCNIQFRTLEGKLPVYLPKDVGVFCGPIRAPVERVQIDLRRTRSRTALGLDDPAAHATWARGSALSPAEVEIRVQGRLVDGRDGLAATLNELRRRVPRPADPREDDPLSVTIDANEGVLYDDVVGAVDVLLESRFAAITFRGAPLDA